MHRIFLRNIFVILFFSWAYFAEFDQIISSEGRLIVDSKLQVAQHLEGGIVKKIHVKVGDSSFESSSWVFVTF